MPGISRTPFLISLCAIPLLCQSSFAANAGQESDEFVIRAAPVDEVAGKSVQANQIHSAASTGARAQSAANVNPMDTPYWRERAAYYRQVAEASKVLAPESNASDAEKQFAVALMKKDSVRATEALLYCIDFRNKFDVNTRLGALKGLEALKTNHPTVSAYLAMSAVADPEAKVRKSDVDLIKSRKDDGAVGGMMHYLMDDFDGAGKVLDSDIRDNAVEGLRALHDDKRIYESLLYYVTLELRVANVELSGLKTRQIDTFQNIGGTIIPISLPIQFPELKITEVKTTVRCPAVNVLRELSGQDFGMDAGKWEHWIRRNIK